MNPNKPLLFMLLVATALTLAARPAHGQANAALLIKPWAETRQRMIELAANP